MESSAKRKILNLLLVLSFQVGYLEWGGSNSSFIFRAEWDIIRKAASAPPASVYSYSAMRAAAIARYTLSKRPFAQINPCRISLPERTHALSVLYRSDRDECKNCVCGYAFFDCRFFCMAKQP